MSRDVGVFYLTLFLIIGTSGLFFGFDCPYLASSLSPAIPVVDGLLFVFVMATLLRTSLTDPGIIPRATADEAASIERQIEMVPNGDDTHTYRPPPRTQDINIRGQMIKIKYCFTCKIFRPPRASHCSVCDNCVERFDHHCPWVANCVGQRNYRYFYLFLVSLSLHAIYIFACTLAHLVLLSRSSDFITAIQSTPASIVVAVVCFFSIWSVLGLAGFHTYLTVSGQTTNEDIKGTYSSRYGEDVFNPYSYGSFCSNYCAVVCGPVLPSVIDLRGYIVPAAMYSDSKPAEYNTVSIRHDGSYGTADLLAAEQLPADGGYQSHKSSHDNTASD
jgi:palmitoyltransferase ZDHHC9/14/18